MIYGFIGILLLVICCVLYKVGKFKESEFLFYARFYLMLSLVMFPIAYGSYDVFDEYHYFKKDKITKEVVEGTPNNFIFTIIEGRDIWTLKTKKYYTLKYDNGEILVNHTENINDLKEFCDITNYPTDFVYNKKVVEFKE